jgi:hypothetical protein
MSGISLDYAVRGELKNSPVREVDVARLRRLWGGVAVGAVLVLLLLYSAYLQFRIADLGYQIRDVEIAYDAEGHLREHLLLEIDALRSPALLAAQAVTLKLVPPDAAMSFVIERVTTSTPPDQTVIAAR